MSFETEKQKKWINEERIPWYQADIQKRVGLEITIKVDFSGFPDDAQKIRGFDGSGLGPLRNRICDAAKDNDFKDYISSKIKTISIAGDENLDSAKYEYDDSSQTLKITATSKAQHWMGNPIDFIKKM